jgi:hypothetical protein
MASKKATISPADALPALLHHGGGSYRVTKAAIETEQDSKVEVIDEGDALVLRLHRSAKP